MSDYESFLKSKEGSNNVCGFDPLWMPDFLFDFQTHLVEWSIKQGRGALYEDCGCGKTVQFLVWAENILRKENGKILILAPLAVSKQTVREGEKFGIEVHNARNGDIVKGINIANYERLKYFDPKDFIGVVLDESGILKGFERKYCRSIIEFMAHVKYRLLCTATPAPNDYIELGTSSEGLGNMTRNQMLGMFFSHSGDSTQKWELKGHAKKGYWKWVAGWARALRKPSDFGYDDGDFILPPLNTIEHVLPSSNKYGRGFFNFATTLKEQREEKRRTIHERCEKVASLIPEGRPSIVWCHLNDEGNLLERLIPNAVQVAGSDKDEDKEDRLLAFANGEIKVLVTKPRIAGFGLNMQVCADIFCFPSHSFESFYQMVRRCWRFGQKNEVNCNIICTEAERIILRNMLRKERQSEKMFAGIIRYMHDYQVKSDVQYSTERMEVPEWM